jgi:hypothetical protein
MKIRYVGAELFQADGQTEMTKLIVAFRNIYYVHRILTIPTLKRLSYFFLDSKFFVVLCNNL